MKDIAVASFGTTMPVTAIAIFTVLGLLCTACTSASSDEVYPGPPYGEGVGDTLDNLAMLDLDGEPFEIASLYGGRPSVVVLYVTATWCFTCGPEIAWLNDELPRRPELGALAVVVQDIDFQPATPEDGRLFREEWDVQFPVVVDSEAVTEPLRRSNAIPLNVLVRTADMTIVHRSEGFDEAALEAAIDAASEGG